MACVTSRCKMYHFIDSFPNCWAFVPASIFALKNNKMCWIFFFCLCRATVHPGPIWTLSKSSFDFGFARTQNGRCQLETNSWEESEDGPFVPLVGHTEAPSKQHLPPGSGSSSLPAFFLGHQRASTNFRGWPHSPALCLVISPHAVQTL